MRLHLFIWTNYEQPSEDMGKLGAVYLSSYVLKLAGLDMTPYNRFLLELSETYPSFISWDFMIMREIISPGQKQRMRKILIEKQVLDYEPWLITTA